MAVECKDMCYDVRVGKFWKEIVLVFGEVSNRVR